MGRKKKMSRNLAATSGALTQALLAALLLAAVQPAQAQTETVLFSFEDNGTGYIPVAPVVRDTKGNLYGTTQQGGNHDNCGTVFELTPLGTETILHSFGETATDGCTPGAGLVRDTKGNLYGTTEQGGAHDNCGTVFELTPSGTETILHRFGETATDGCNPFAGLVRDTKGNLYGTTEEGGTGTCSGGCGTVFEVTSSGTETILHSFGETATDGTYPHGLVRDTEGNLYGTTVGGGTYGYGTVFKLTSSGRETILHGFGKTATDGTSPDAGLVRDTKGNLYGTTPAGGTGKCSGGCGTVFELTSSGTETILHSFVDNGTDGTNPEAGLVRDTEGNLYGTTNNGGGTGTVGCGTVFEVTSSGTETILHSFCETARDGGSPLAGLIRDAEGNLYGTTSSGGTYLSYGTVFEVTPKSAEDAKQ
jgi:uncharacterized repeat protein (TIGR03803 family)